MFTYVLLAGLATPALLYAAGGAGDSTPPRAATTAQAGEPGGTTSTQAAPAPAAAPTPAPAPPPAPAPQAAPAAVPAKPAHPKEASVAAPTKPVKLRAVAHTAGSDTISDFKFTPPSITVKVGDTVVWTNDGPSAHSATADDGSFDSGLLSKNATGSFKFTKAGKFVMAIGKSGQTGSNKTEVLSDQML